jgi:hypothetical protein
VKARRVLSLIAAGWVVLLAWPSSTAACSPPFEQPTIRAHGPAQLVVVGIVGERVPGGRFFHVERWFNGGEPGTPIVIAFKEGEPIGDCSYPVATGERKIIAPWREPDGRLSADLGTLQADPNSVDGRRYLDEAVALFGPGVVPQAVDAPVDPVPASDGLQAEVVIATLALAVAGVVVGLVARWRRTAG